MFHARIDGDTAEPVAQTLTTMQTSLAVLAAGLDARFVQAGNTLVTAVETIDRVIAALDGVVNALDEKAAGAAVDTLLDTARTLSGLPRVQAARAADLQAVSRTAAQLREGVMDMHQVLRVLGIYGLNIKIAASGSVEFVCFVDGMAARLGVGEQHLEGFLAKLKELADGIASVQRSERLLAGECGKILPHIPEKLAKDAGQLQAYQVRIAEMAGQVGGIARAIQGRVGTVLGALQIGDITRQRLEHVVSGLQMLLARPDCADEDAAVTTAIEGRVFRLLAAQLDDLGHDFEREAVLLVESIGALGPDTNRLLDLIESGGSGAEGRAFLQQLESGITDVDRVTGQLRDADEGSKGMGRVIADAADELATRLTAIRGVRADVQHMAVNTRLRCNHTGLIGKAVAVIAAEVNDYAGRLDRTVIAVAKAIEDMGVASGSLRQRHQTGGRLDPGAALTTIREGCRRTERGVSEGGDDARELIRMLGGASDELAGELALRTPLDDASADLLALAGGGADSAVPDAAVAPLSDLLMAIGALYTMASERVVHQRFLLPGMTIDTAATAAPASDDDLFDDALF